ncbi:MAG TPA: hypothetical protein PLZ61_07340, partial [Candidatus Cryosericum sp.]|nr:hypothetical protein [Candidatus Cryosericum sp.]
PRSAAEDLVRSLGGETSDTLSRKVTTLVVGAAPGSKLAKAQALGTEILTEEQFLTLVGNNH